MPFGIHHLPHTHRYRVINETTGQVHAKHATLPDAQAQLRILESGYARDHHERLPTEMVHHPYHGHSVEFSQYKPHSHQWVWHPQY